MEAVASELGVDRKAVHYHVTDRNNLVRLVAIEAFHTEMAKLSIDTDGDWKSTVRQFATGMKDAYIATGELISYLRFETERDARALVSSETVLEVLVDAGLTALEAARAITMVSVLAMGYARDYVLATRPEGHPQPPEIHRVVQHLDPAEFPVLREVIDSHSRFDDPELFTFEVDVVLLGLQHTLQGRDHRD